MTKNRTLTAFIGMLIMLTLIYAGYIVTVPIVFAKVVVWILMIAAIALLTIIPYLLEFIKKQYPKRYREMLEEISVEINNKTFWRRAQQVFALIPILLLCYCIIAYVKLMLLVLVLVYILSYINLYSTGKNMIKEAKELQDEKTQTTV